MPRMGILIDVMSFMSTHIDFLLILRLGEKCAGYLKLLDTRMPDKRDFTVYIHSQPSFLWTSIHRTFNSSVNVRGPEDCPMQAVFVWKVTTLTGR